MLDIKPAVYLCEVWKLEKNNLSPSHHQRDLTILFRIILLYNVLVNKRLAKIASIYQTRKRNHHVICL